MSDTSSSPLHALLNQLSLELHECLRKIIPDISEEALNQTKKAEYPDKYEEVEKIKEKRNFYLFYLIFKSKFMLIDLKICCFLRK